MPDKKQPAEKWYALSPDDVLGKLNANQAEGLTSSEAEQRQSEYGKNELPSEEGTPLWRMVLEQFQDVTVILLIIAAAISIGVGEAQDSFVILVIVVLNALIGVYQEQQAENALASLGKMQTPNVRARRDGHVVEVPATELVPGDIVMLEAGNSIPADGRLLQASNVKIDEAAMTGESVAVDKSVRAMEDTQPPPAVADRQNMVYMGTTMTYGRAEFVVTETGLKTQLGNIAAMLQNVERTRTPLQERLEKMGYVLAGAALTICAFVFIAGVARGEDINEMFLTAVSLAVAAVPEGLPAVITVSLALGANRMVKRNALIRKLPAVETLGSVTTICSDKTGTLTRNEMTVKTIFMPDHEQVTVTGVGYEPVGRFMGGGKRDSLQVVNDEQLARFLKASALCTDAYVEKASEDGPWQIVGDTTEGALLVMAMKQGWSRESLEEDMPRVAEIPFTSERKAMTTIHAPKGKFASELFDQAPYVSFTKGAPDQLVKWAGQEMLSGEHVAITDDRRQAWLDEIERLANEGMRVLGVAYRTWDDLPADPQPDVAERDFILLGLVGIVDPPREEATRAVNVAKHAGIRAIMITGDHKLTAQSIAQQLGIIQDKTTERAMIGSELDVLSQDELQKTVKEVNVYARVSPEHKLRIVEALQKNGQIVAMTGDGVNDAPTLKQASIGVAMGITGTDVSKGAADMVLTDDNFASIVSAVEEGRTIYDNIRKFLKYLLGSNSGEILTMFAAILVGFKLPLVATQILWINLVTDGLPAIALGFERSEEGVMDRGPRPPKQSIFAQGVGVHIVWVGIWMAIVSLTGYILMLLEHGGELFEPTDENLTIARSMAFFVLATTQVAHVTAIHGGFAPFFARPFWQNRLLLIAVISTVLLQLGAIYIPFMQDLLSTTALRAQDILLAFILAISIIPAVEVEKAIWRRREAAEAEAEGRAG